MRDVHYHGCDWTCQRLRLTASLVTKDAQGRRPGANNKEIFFEEAPKDGRVGRCATCTAVVVIGRLNVSVSPPPYSIPPRTRRAEGPEETTRNFFFEEAPKDGRVGWCATCTTTVVIGRVNVSVSPPPSLRRHEGPKARSKHNKIFFGRGHDGRKGRTIRDVRNYDRD